MAVPPMVRSRRLLLVVALCLAVVFGPTAAVDAQDAPAATTRIRHQSGPYWVWFGPANYSGSGSAYGITILGPGGAVLDQGFSSILCANGATWPQSVTNYFSAKRREIRDLGFQILTASNVARPAATGVNYRRQNLTVRRTAGGVTKRGVFQFDYDFSTSVDGINYCFARNLGMYANNAAWQNGARQTLDSINRSLAYSGPGACDPSPSTPC